MKEISNEQPEELRASKIASGVSIVMALLKLLVGFSAGSLSLLASGLDSLFDALASGLGFILLKMSLEPADAEHPYGHSRIESIASLGQGVLLFFIALGFAYSAAHRFSHSFEPQRIDAALFTTFLCTVVTLVLWIYLGKVVRKTNSPVIMGDRLHYFGDLAGNILLFVGFIISQYWHAVNVDAILTLILCVFILSSGFKIISDAIKDLVDHADPELDKHIKLLVTDYFPKALGTELIRSRKTGRRTAMDIELLCCRLLTLQKVHDISHEVQTRIVESVPHVDIIIHSEPCRIEQCPTDFECQYKKHLKV